MKNSNTIENLTEKAIIQLADEYYRKDNFSRAFELYKQAAEKGNRRAQYNVGLFYFKGIAPIEKNYEMAFSWFEKSASQGFSNALYKLGRMYEKGLGVEIDFIGAYSFYWRANREGNKKAIEKLKNLYITVNNKSKQGDAEAKQILEKFKEKRQELSKEQSIRRKEIISESRENLQKVYEEFLEEIGKERWEEISKESEEKTLSNRYLYTTRIHYEKAFEIASGEPVTIAINPIQIQKGFVAIHVGKYTTFLLDSVQFNEFLQCIPENTKIEYKICKARSQKITNKDELLLKKAKEAVQKGDSIYLFIL